MTSVEQNPEETTYTYASQPKAVGVRRPCYRSESPDDREIMVYGNIMYDRRVIRGNTYALPVLPANAYPDPVDLQKRQDALRRANARRRAGKHQQMRSIDAVEGREHRQVQTGLYLEELTDLVEEYDVECQTDAILDRCPSPFFVPGKVGIDAMSQVYEGDLFDFDLESKPVLEVLVGKTLEQSLLEVLEEEELADLRQQQRIFEELRNAEMAEQQRLEEQERRLQEEKERRMKQLEETLKREKEMAAKMAAHAYAQSYLNDLVPSVFSVLSETGYFYDSIVREVEQSFLPWLIDSAVEQLEKSVRSRLILDEVLRDIVWSRAAASTWLQQQYDMIDEAHREALEPPGEDTYQYWSQMDAEMEEGEEEEMAGTGGVQQAPAAPEIASQHSTQAAAAGDETQKP